MSSDTKSSSASSSNQPANPQFTPSPLDCAKAGTGVWLVKVPKYLAKKWLEAPENSEVGVIRITQSKVKMKQDVVFHLNESLASTIKPGDEKVPIEHKFMMNPPGNQALYVLKQPDDDLIKKDGLSIIGKVMQRAECTPIQNDSKYIELKRETNKQFFEPKRQMKMASDFLQKQHFLPKNAHVQNMEKKDKTKRLRENKETVLDLLFNAFTKHQYYNIKDLVKLTKQPPGYLKDILHEICKYNGKGAHKNMWELKDEYKQSNANSEQNKKAAVASLSKSTGGGASASGSGAQNIDELMDDDDDDNSEDFDDVDDEDNDLEEIDDDGGD